MKFFITDFFSKCDQIRNGKLHFFCSGFILWVWMTSIINSTLIQKCKWTESINGNYNSYLSYEGDDVIGHKWLFLPVKFILWTWEVICAFWKCNVNLDLWFDSYIDNELKKKDYKVYKTSSLIYFIFYQYCFFIY